MKSSTFVNRRGDEYSFVLYSTNEVKIVRRFSGGGLVVMNLSDDATTKLKEFLRSLV